MKQLLKVLLVLALAVAVFAAVGQAKPRKAEKGAWLGIYMQTIDEDLAEVFELDEDYGVVINEIIEDSPAEEAGLEEDDIIIAIDGRKIFDSDDLVDLLEDADEGDQIKLEIVRDDDRKTIAVVLGEEPKTSFRRHFNWSSPGRKDVWIYNDKPDSYIGVHLSDLSKQLGNYFGVKKGRGVLITEVVEDSPAEEAGLLAGDIIVAIDEDKVNDYEDVLELVGEAEPGEKITVAVMREKRNEKMEVTVGERENEYSFGHFDGSFRMPDIDIQIPDIDRSFRDHYLHNGNFFDQDELTSDLEDLRDELKNLKKELKEIEKKLD